MFEGECSLALLSRLSIDLYMYVYISRHQVTKSIAQYTTKSGASLAIHQLVSIFLASKLK